MEEEPGNTVVSGHIITSCACFNVNSVIFNVMLSDCVIYLVVVQGHS